MKFSYHVTLGVLAMTVSVAGPAWSADEQLGGIKLLDGYKYQPLQGIDSIVGRISKPGGLEITYEIGSIPKPGRLRLGGQFSDRPKRVPKDQLRWYREQTVGGQPVHLAYRKDNYLMVSFPKKGTNISVKVATPEEMADALLMILTYPTPVAGDGPKKK